MTVVLDTTFLVDLEREVAGARDLFEEFVERGERFVVPTVVAAEYLGGSRDPEADRERLEASVSVLDFTLDDALAAAAVGRETLARGDFPGWTDALIAGFARNRGDLPVVTANPEHFPLTETVDWREG